MGGVFMQAKIGHAHLHNHSSKWRGVKNNVSEQAKGAESSSVAQNQEELQAPTPTTLTLQLRTYLP